MEDQDTQRCGEQFDICVDKAADIEQAANVNTIFPYMRNNFQQEVPSSFQSH